MMTLGSVSAWTVVDGVDELAKLPSLPLHAVQRHHLKRRPAHRQMAIKNERSE